MITSITCVELNISFNFNCNVVQFNIHFNFDVSVNVVAI